MSNEVSSILEQKLPLFIVTGSSGSGKTYIISELRNVWLRVARNIAESGRMTIICGTAMTWVGY